MYKQTNRDKNKTQNETKQSSASHLNNKSELHYELKTT